MTWRRCVEMDRRCAVMSNDLVERKILRDGMMLDNDRISSLESIQQIQQF